MAIDGWMRALRGWWRVYVRHGERSWECCGGVGGVVGLFREYENCVC